MYKERWFFFDSGEDQHRKIMEHSPLSHSLFLSNPVMRGNPTLPLCGPRTPQCTLQAALASLSDQCHVGPGVMYSSIVCNSWGRARSLPLGKPHFPILGLAAHWTLSSSLPLFPVSRTSCTRFWLCALGFQNFTDQTQCWHKLHFLLVEFLAPAHSFGVSLLSYLDVPYTG